MSEEHAWNIYYPGDEVRIKVSFTHPANFVDVEAVYAHVEHESYTLTLSGEPELIEGSPSTGDNKRSTATLTEKVDVKHIPGSYRAVRTVFYTFSGASLTIAAHDTEPPAYGPFFGGEFELPKILFDQWPEIEARPEIPYAKITGVDLVGDYE